MKKLIKRGNDRTLLDEYSIGGFSDCCNTTNSTSGSGNTINSGNGNGNNAGCNNGSGK